MAAIRVPIPGRGADRIAGAAQTGGQAPTEATDLAKQTQNPVSSLISLPAAGQLGLRAW